jgi:hypothetical protein
MTKPPDPDPHADGYRVDLETDPMRAAAHLLADFVSQDMLQPYNERYTLKAMAGDAGSLLTNTKVALHWINLQMQRDPGTTINAWTAYLMQALGEWPGAPLP